LGFDRILARCRLIVRQVALSKAVVLGRLIESGSDFAIWRWLSEHSILPELEPELTQVGNNTVKHRKSVPQWNPEILFSDIIIGAISSPCVS
jgi:hypothetical protein